MQNNLHAMALQVCDNMRELFDSHMFFLSELMPVIVYAQEVLPGIITIYKHSWDISSTNQTCET